MILNHLSDYQQSRTGNKDQEFQLQCHVYSDPGVQEKYASACSVMYIQILVFKKSMQVPEVQVCLMCVDKNHFLGYHTKLQVYSML